MQLLLIDDRHRVGVEVFVLSSKILGILEVVLLVQEPPLLVFIYAPPLHTHSVYPWQWFYHKHGNTSPSLLSLSPTYPNDPIDCNTVKEEYD
jgi:hypothetical protein